ncbi:MAG: hypothetical protein JSS02_00240 [Planctomycetes bacterium]|nr:hypothetical protein [Planctomycetota bacterium]
MSRFFPSNRICRQRIVALVSLLLFTMGNIGWPVTLVSATGGTCCQVSGRAVCCCGQKPGTRNCGCGQALAQSTRKAPQKNLPPCCQKRMAEAAPIGVSARCACGDGSDPVLVLATQPKLPAATVQFVHLQVHSRLNQTPPQRITEPVRTPETPPPRTSAV